MLKNIQPPRFDWILQIQPKEIPFLALLVLCGGIIGRLCHSISQQYEQMFFPFSQALKSAAWTFVALLVVTTIISLATLLVRPWRALMLGHVLGAIALLFTWRGGWISFLGIAIYLAGMAFYTKILTRELDQRLVFSLRPMGYEQRKLFLTFSLLLSVSFAWGYRQALEPGDVEIPESYRQAAADLLLSRLAVQLDHQPGLSPIQRAIYLQEAHRSVEGLFNRTEAAIQPYVQFIPVGLVLPLLVLLQSLLATLGWIPILFLEVLIPLLRVFKIAQVVTETKEQRILKL